MEGYSVTEAASVLGVPTERVWELLARGVLSGVPDGETGMRVYLQPRPAPPAVEEQRRSNGGGSTREPEAEASPFRELLSEFRNLTERYGQALLALGESRGEVASLRSRVDLLEARFDLRLPMSGPMTAQAPTATGWNPGQPVARPMVEAPMPSEDAPAAPPDHEAEPSPRRRRRRGQHRATDDFAEALARAEDPSPAELPGGQEAAAAFAALRDEAQRATEHGDAALPRELPAAEPIAIIEPDEVADASPEPIAEAPAAPAVEAEAVVEASPEPIAEVSAPPVIEPEAVADMVPEPISESQPPPSVEEAPEAEPEPVAEPEPEPDAWFEPERAAEAEPFAESLTEPPPSEAEPEAAVGAYSELVAEAPPWPMAEPIDEREAEPEPAAEMESIQAEPEAVVEEHPEPAGDASPAAELVPPVEAESEPEPQPEPEAEPEAEPEPEAGAGEASAPVLEVEPEGAEDEIDADMAEANRMLAGPIEPDAITTAPADDAPDEPTEAESASEWADVAGAEPAADSEVGIERAAETEPGGVADTESSWDRDRYTARIEELDWIPEERAAQPPATSAPDAPRAFAGVPRAEPVSEDGEEETSTPEPPWVGEPEGSTQRDEEMMMWFGREPERPDPATPTQEDFAAEMEVASSGAHAARPASVPHTDTGVRPVSAALPETPPTSVPERRFVTPATSSVRPQPPSPASRAYRRLRRIFPG